MKKLFLGTKTIILCAFFSVCFLQSNAQKYILSTVAGNGSTNTPLGDGGLAVNAGVYYPVGVGVNDSGNIYLIQGVQSSVREIYHATGIINTVAGTGSYNGDGGLADTTEFIDPFAVAFDDSDNIYIAEYNGNRIRKINHATGIVSTVAGTGTAGYNGDGGLADTTQLNGPSGVAVDSSGNIYISEYGDHRVRRIDHATSVISTIAGTGTYGYNGDGGLADTSKLNDPYGLVLDDSDNVYIVDYYNNRIRKVNHATGIITTVAGNGTGGYSGDGGLADTSEINQPYAVMVDSIGNIYIADYGNERVRKINHNTGIITTIAGTGTYGYNGDGGIGDTSQINGPSALAIDKHGDVYMAEYDGQRLRKLTPQPGSVLDFNGTNNYVSGSIFSTITNNLTMEARVNWGGSTASNQMIMVNGNTGTNGYAVFVDHTNNDSLSVLCGGVYIMKSDAKLTPGSWQMVSVVRNNGAWTLYLDGTAYPLNYSTNPNAITSGAFTIGASQAGEYFNGQIDEARFWSRPLCQNEIQFHMNCSLAGNEPGLVSLYNFNEGLASADNSTVTTLIDSSGNVHNLTLYNFTLNGSSSNWVTPPGTLGPIHCGSYVPPAPVITAGGNTVFCQGDSVLLTATSGTAYLWSNGATTQSTYITSSGMDSVTVTNPGGCYGTVGSAPTNITVNPLPVLTITGTDTIPSGDKDTLMVSGASTYMWTSGPASDTNIVVPTSDSTFYVTGTDANGCSATDSFKIVIMVATGINNVIADNGVFVYPNPAANTMYLKFNTKGKADAAITIMDARGREVMSQQSEVSNGKVLPVDISALPAGVYFVHVVANGRAQVIKFIRR